MNGTLTVTDRDLLGGILTAIGKLHMAVTGEPLQFDLKIEGGYLAICEPADPVSVAHAGYCHIREATDFAPLSRQIVEGVKAAIRRGDL